MTSNENVRTINKNHGPRKICEGKKPIIVFCKMIGLSVRSHPPKFVNHSGFIERPGHDAKHAWNKSKANMSGRPHPWCKKVAMTANGRRVTLPMWCSRRLASSTVMLRPRQDLICDMQSSTTSLKLLLMMYWLYKGRRCQNSMSCKTWLGALATILNQWSTSPAGSSTKSGCDMPLFLRQLWKRNCNLVFAWLIVFNVLVRLMQMCMSM